MVFRSRIWSESVIATVGSNAYKKCTTKTIVDCMITATKAGLVNISRDDLESLYMSGGHVSNVVRAMVSATKAKIPMTYEQAAAIDLAGRDVLDAVKTSVNPKVIDTPAVEAVAKDGIQVIVKARITVRSDINKLVGGAGEETVLARVGECIVTSIGSADTHEEVMEILTIYLNLLWKKDLIVERPMKFFLLILQMLIWAKRGSRIANRESKCR